VGGDYGASTDTVSFTMGYGSGLLTALGALLGGRFLDRLDKRRAYLLSGLLIAVVDAVMACAPRSTITYIAGTLVYSLVAGLCFAAFTAVVLEIIGEVDRSAATQYTLFDAAGNLATSYLAWMDGHGYDLFKAHARSGPAGLLLTDAGMNVAGVIGLVLMMYCLRRRHL
jgi:predicted MFS family arabinose efflux permease